MGADGEFVDREVDLFRFNDPSEITGSGDSHRKMEVQANQFAAALLMPRNMVEEKFKAGITDLANLAHLFRVSEEAMGYRLDQLGLVNG